MLAHGHDDWNINSGYSETLGKSHVFRVTEQEEGSGSLMTGTIQPALNCLHRLHKEKM